MITAAIIFLLISIISGALGFGVLRSVAGLIARTIFGIFIILFLLFVILIVIGVKILGLS